MKQILLRFEGNEDGEERAAGMIQEAVFRVLDQEKMCVKSFANITINPAPQPPVRTGGILQVPNFMKKRRDKRTVSTKIIGGDYDGKKESN